MTEQELYNRVHAMLAGIAHWEDAAPDMVHFCRSYMGPQETLERQLAQAILEGDGVAEAALFDLLLEQRGEQKDVKKRAVGKCEWRDCQEAGTEVVESCWSSGDAVLCLCLEHAEKVTEDRHCGTIHCTNCGCWISQD